MIPNSHLPWHGPRPGMDENDAPPGNVVSTVVPVGARLQPDVKSAQALGIVAASTRIRSLRPCGFRGRRSLSFRPKEVVLCRSSMSAARRWTSASRSWSPGVRRPDSGGGGEQQVRSFATFGDELEQLRDWLVAEGVTHVAMEATGSYWKPVVRHEALFDRGEVKGLSLRAVAAVR